MAVSSFPLLYYTHTNSPSPSSAGSNQTFIDVGEEGGMVVQLVTNVTFTSLCFLIPNRQLISIYSIPSSSFLTFVDCSFTPSTPTTSPNSTPLTPLNYTMRVEERVINMYNMNFGQVELTRCEFRSLSLPLLYLNGAVHLTNCTFLSNSALLLYAINANISLHSLTLSNNSHGLLSSPFILRGELIYRG